MTQNIYILRRCYSNRWYAGLLQVVRRDKDFFPILTCSEYYEKMYDAFPVDIVDYRGGQTINTHIRK